MWIYNMYQVLYPPSKTHQHQNNDTICFRTAEGSRGLSVTAIMNMLQDAAKTKNNVSSSNF